MIQTINFFGDDIDPTDILASRNADYSQNRNVDIENAKNKVKEYVRNTWDDWHILAISRPVFAPPKAKTSYIEVPGGNGVLDLSESLSGYPLYNNRTGTFSFRIMNMHSGWAEHYSSIMDFLHGRHMRAILDDDEEWFYEGRFTVEERSSADTWSEITIGYDVNPFKWRVSSSSGPWLWDPFNFATGVIWDAECREIPINSPNSFKEISFPSHADDKRSIDAFFGIVPISPDITITSSRGTGMDIRFVNSYLGIDITQHFNEGKTFAPDFLFYGQVTPYKLYFRGQGTVTIDFKIGRL